MRTLLLVSSIFSLVVTFLPFIKAPVGVIRIWEFPRLQIVFVLVLTLIGWIYFHPRNAVDVALIAGLIFSFAYQSYTILPYTRLWKKQVSGTTAKDPQNAVSILFYNVFMSNKNCDELLKLVEKKDPDLVLLVETDDYWARHLKPLQSRYPHFQEVPLDNTYGMMLYSRLPLNGAKVHFLLKDDIPSIHAYVQLPGGQQVKLYCVHPEPPGLVKSTTDRDSELLQVAKLIEKRKEPCIVAGDLNDVAWSASTHLFGKISKCNDPRIGRGLLNSFNAKVPLMRWPLDHFFLSHHFTVDEIERQEYIGSDHFPMFIKATFTRSGNTGTGTEPVEPGDEKEAEEKIREGVEKHG